MTGISCESRFRVMCLRCRVGERRPLYGSVVDYGRASDPEIRLPQCGDCKVKMVPVSYQRLESQIIREHELDLERQAATARLDDGRL